MVSKKQSNTTGEGGSSAGNSTAGSKCKPSPVGNGKTSFADTSVFRCRHLADWLARFAFCGIFLVENVFHYMNFDEEMTNMVEPALKPLPRELGVGLHVMHIVLGLFGASFVIISGFDAAGRTALRKGASMMMVFMLTITWTWWLNRGGVFYTELEAGPEKRNRMVHILKNISIFGALNLVQRLARYDEEANDVVMGLEAAAKSDSSSVSHGRTTFDPATGRTRRRVSALEGFITSLRVWTFPACVMPVLLVVVCLSVGNRFSDSGSNSGSHDAILHARYEVFATKPLIFGVLLSLMAVQAGANLLNSLCDFKNGCDVRSSAGDRTLVDGLVSKGVCMMLVAFFFAAAISFFVYAFLHIGPVVATPFAAGLLIALLYSAGPFPLKYHALGDVAIFLSFGPCIAVFAGLVLTGGYNVSGRESTTSAQFALDALFGWMMSRPCLLSLPGTAYTVAILHANNVRDMQNDLRARARTVANMMGQSVSLLYYDFLLLICAHGGALVLGLGYFKCYGVICTLWVLPLSLWLMWRIRGNDQTLKNQDAKTAQCQALFGLALVIGLATMPGQNFCSAGFYVSGVVVTVLHVLGSDDDEPLVGVAEAQIPVGSPSSTRPSTLDKSMKLKTGNGVGSICRLVFAVLAVCVAVVVAAILTEEPHIVAQGDLGFAQTLGLETADSREILEQFGAMKKKWQKEEEEKVEAAISPTVVHPKADFSSHSGNYSLPSGLARATIMDSIFFGSGAMFDRIAAIYDITNRCMSLGLDQKWRAYMVNTLWGRIDSLLNEGATPANSTEHLVVDLAAGTSDVGIHVVQQAQMRSKQAAVIGVDPSREMLLVGQGKVEQLGLATQIDLRVGDAQNLYEENANQIESDSVDAVTMSFGIRNVPDRFKALREMHRVLKVDHEVNILEFNLPDGTLSPVFSTIARLFITHVIPTIGLLTTFGKGSAEYDYFQDSISGFPHWQNFAKLLNAAGFEVQEVTHFAFGAVQYYRGRKVEL